MTFKSGFGSNAKQVIYRLSPQEGDAELYSLTPRQVKALLANTDYLSWLNRHQSLPEDIPDKDGLEAWVSNLNLALMTPMTPPELDCDFIVDCITSALDNPASPLYQAIKDKIKDDPQFLDDLRKAITPFPAGELGASSELPKLWAQCVQVVEFTHGRILAMFADIEVQSNNLEIATFTEALPFIGTAIDELQIDVALDFVNYEQEIWKEQYEANYTEDPPPDLGSKWVLACSLFCMTKTDGNITIEDIVLAFSAPITSGGLSMDSVGEILQTLIGINENNPNIVYLTFTAVWGIARLASYVGGTRITQQILGNILKLAENDANDDYETYCADCITIIDTWTPKFLLFEPPDTAKGEVNKLADWEFEFTSGNSYGYNRIGQRWDGGCFRILSLDYPSIAFPGYVDCAGTYVEGSYPVEGECYQAIVGADASPFSIHIIMEACPDP